MRKKLLFNCDAVCLLGRFLLEERRGVVADARFCQAERRVRVRLEACVGLALHGALDRQEHVLCDLRIGHRRIAFRVLVLAELQQRRLPHRGDLRVRVLGVCGLKNLISYRILGVFTEKVPV